MTDPTKEPTSFAQREVAIAASVALWLVTNGTGLIVKYGHLHAGSLNALGSYLTPIVSAGVLGVFGVVLRRFVSPAWKVAQAEGKKLGVTVPDFPSYTDEEIAASLAALPDGHPLKVLNADLVPAAPTAPAEPTPAPAAPPTS